MKPLMINATDRNVINHENYIFYFNKLLKLNNIKIQNDVLTKEMNMGKGIKYINYWWKYKLRFNYIDLYLS